MNGALAGLAILVIGDSHMSHMMTSLHGLLEDNGAAVNSYFMCGATPGDWIYPAQVPWWAGCGKGERHEKEPVVLNTQQVAPTYSLVRLIAADHPNLIVVQLGDGLGRYGAGQLDRQWIVDQVHLLTGKIAAANIACVWVGPTWGQDKPPYNKLETETTELSRILAASVSPCRYIDSSAFSRPGEWPTKDGSHLMPDAYRKWSVDITDAIVRLKSQVVSAAQ
jgi:hypothetical protein